MRGENCLKTASALNTQNKQMSRCLQNPSLCVSVRAASSASRTLLAATFHRFLHILGEGRPVVACEGEAPPADPQGSTAGGGGADALLAGSPASTPTLHPGEGFDGLAEGGAALQPVEIPDGLASAWRLCRRCRRLVKVCSCTQLFKSLPSSSVLFSKRSHRSVQENYPISPKI